MISEILKNMKLRHRFRDPIYGFINLSDAEKKIVDTPIFQRLRRIHQLALEKYVFPGAEHSRFGHSLGVLHAATRLFESTLSKALEEMKFSNEEKEDFVGKLTVSIKMLRFCALLHDIGHLPFSHALETELLPKGVKHEHIGAYIIEQHPVISKILTEEDIDPSRIAALLVSKKEEIRFEDSFVKMFISGDLDADRADYLLRDSYYCGVKYGVYDFERYLSSMLVKSIEDLKLEIKSDDVPIVEEFLMARYQYNIQVIYHRTRVMYNIALGEFIKADKEKRGKFYRLFDDTFKFDENNANAIDKIDFDKFESFNDYTFFFLLDSYPKDDYWTQCLARGDQHLTMIIERLKPSKKGKREFDEVCSALKKSGFQSGADFFAWDKNIKLHELGDEIDAIRVIGRDEKDLGPVDEYSIILSSLEKQDVFIWRIYVKSCEDDKRKKILETVNKVLQK